MVPDWISIEKQYYAQTVKRQPVVIERGLGTRVWDVNGKEYLDFTAGWAVTNIGHSHPAIVDAITKQAATLMQTSNAFYTIPQLHLAKLLVVNSCYDKVFFGNSGAEAIEGAIKLARKYGKANRDGAYGIITAYNSFHGRTISTLAATGQPHYQETFRPLTPGFTHVEFNNMDQIREATSDKIAAVMLEPIQGEGGVNVPDENYLSEVKKWCEAQGLLFIVDEVQTGMGRLGSLFGYQEYGIEPDVMALAKGLGGGVPIGAFMSKENCMSLEPGDHGSTFGGNALTTAAAYASTKYIIDNNIPDNAKNMGNKLMQCLNDLKSVFSCIEEVRGKGLLIAIQFDGDIADRALELVRNEGVLSNMVKPNALRLMPPLTITKQEIEEGIERIGKALKKL
ncbi:aspartate aminotransferase family protein [SAR202 cluster bacterium AC-409-J13_OGT_754m]|nr:aspartate aminotransferase family protein [SAR202 cluster bacterium AC-409-J13_OGT_754m]